MQVVWKVLMILFLFVSRRWHRRAFPPAAHLSFLTINCVLKHCLVVMLGSDYFTLLITFSSSVKFSRRSVLFTSCSFSPHFCILIVFLWRKPSLSFVSVTVWLISCLFMTSNFRLYLVLDFYKRLWFFLVILTSAILVYICVIRPYPDYCITLQL